jgi:hypothetical protein
MRRLPLSDTEILLLFSLGLKFTGLLHAPAVGRKTCAYMHAESGLLDDARLAAVIEGRAAWGFLQNKSAGHPQGRRAFLLRPYFNSLVIASAAFPATTQLADPATTASSSNQRNPKSSMHSGKSGLIMMYPGITAPGM